ncbi:ATP-binding cassette, subfamily B [Treponema bryantii]|uniref:ATP-binding cassette, subfamily B n=1 Tax=Treponema bryantii TaxID=163 RepID=A0A1H9FJJ9_9SPIR|nr:ABC transporter ATP-binding protein [Treponema bryantii]SEQ38089.1 ATP-binding cassette, subfamily B [Treponema bryantii]
MKSKSNLPFLFRSMGAFKITMLISIVFAALSAIENIYAYTFVYKIAEVIISNYGNLGSVDKEIFYEFSKGIVFAVCAAYGLYGLSLLFSHITAFNTAVQLKKMLICHIGKLPGGYYDSNPSGSLRKIIEKNTDASETLIAHQIPNTTMSIVLPVAFVIFMFRYSVLLSVACLIPVIIGFVLLMVIMMGNGSDFVRTYQQAQKDMSNAAVEYVRGIPVMKTFGQTADSFARYKNSVKGFCEYVYKFAISMMTADSLYNTAMNSVFYTLVPVVLVLWKGVVGGATGVAGAIHLFASFIFFASIIPLEVTILKRIMGNSSESIIVDEAMESLKTILDEKVMEYKMDGDGGIAGELKCDDVHEFAEVPANYGFEFKNVSFRYAPELPLALDGINLSVAEGKTTALVGLSGGGKSTIASLAARLRDVTDGAVMLGGVNIKDISQKKLNELVSIVFQENSLLKMSIAENVALYRKDASRDEIMRALKLAQCKDIIAKLPNGIDSVYGAKGVYLSGGEVQRIAIARAILKDSPIIILDEATAFADAENEYLIRKAFSELLKNKTVIMIAHRMSTVRDADKICVVEAGKIIEEGNHDELMKRGGKYSAMVNEYNRAISWKLGSNDSAKEASNA